MKTTSSVRLTLGVCLGYCSTTLFAPLASALPPESPPTRVVHFGDLDLSKPAGVQALYRRIKFAAHTVCEPYIASGIHSSGAVRACLIQAVDNAVSRVSSPALTQLHTGAANLRLASK